jgi:purine-binding chemotaxis protein CheW
MSDFYGISQDQSAQTGRFLTFMLGAELFAIEAGYVTEINNMISIISIPGTPEYFKGIISLRGKIIPVIDLRLKLRKEPKRYSDKTSIIILRVEEAQIGLIVDNVAEVLSISHENIELIPDMQRSSGNRYLQGIGKSGENFAMILNCKKILAEDEIFDLAQIVS